MNRSKIHLPPTNAILGDSVRHYYKILHDLPRVPLDIEIQAFDEAMLIKNRCLNPVPESYKDRWFIGRDGTPQQSSGYPRNDLGEDFLQWIKQNIASEIIDAGVSFTERPYRSTLGAHTDRTRRYSLLYVLQPGGARVITKWYREPGHEIWRDGIVHINDHTNLELLTELEIPTRTWVCINARCIHSVEGIQTQRIGINVSLDQDVFGLDER